MLSAKPLGTPFIPFHGTVDAYIELPFVRDHNDVIAILGVDIALNDEAMNPQAATVRFASENILVS